MIKNLFFFTYLTKFSEENYSEKSLGFVVFMRIRNCKKNVKEYRHSTEIVFSIKIYETFPAMVTKFL